MPPRLPRFPQGIDPVYRSPRGNPLPFLDIQWSGVTGKRLLAAIVRMRDTGLLLRTIGRKVVVSVRKNFMESRSPEGLRWPGLKKPRSRSHNPGTRPLRDTGALYESITFMVGADHVSIGYPRETFYGRFHQHGTRFIPQRRFLGLRDGDIPDMREAAREHLAGAFR
jgi:phage virion morphogenesis protein